jgi:hypothetical protein
MAALTPAALLSTRRCDRSPCFTLPAFLTLPSPTTPGTPLAAFTHYPSARSVPSRLRLSLAGSPMPTAESSSLSYGRVVHLRLLPTLPRGNAVIFGYGPESAYPERTLTSLSESAPRRTSAEPWFRAFNARRQASKERGHLAPDRIHVGRDAPPPLRSAFPGGLLPLSPNSEFC